MQEKASQADQTTQKNTPKAKLSKYHTQLAIKKAKAVSTSGTWLQSQSCEPETWKREENAE